MCMGNTILNGRGEFSFFTVYESNVNTPRECHYKCTQTHTHAHKGYRTSHAASTMMLTQAHSTHLDLEVSQRYQRPLATPPTIRLLLGDQCASIRGGTRVARDTIGVLVLRS